MIIGRKPDVPGQGQTPSHASPQMNIYELRRRDVPPVAQTGHEPRSDQMSHDARSQQRDPTERMQHDRPQEGTQPGRLGSNGISRSTVKVIKPKRTESNNQRISPPTAGRRSPIPPRGSPRARSSTRTPQSRDGAGSQTLTQYPISQESITGATVPRRSVSSAPLVPFGQIEIVETNHSDASIDNFLQTALDILSDANTEDISTSPDKRARTGSLQERLDPECSQVMSTSPLVAAPIIPSQEQANVTAEDASNQGTLQQHNASSVNGVDVIHNRSGDINAGLIQSIESIQEHLGHVLQRANELEKDMTNIQQLLGRSRTENDGLRDETLRLRAEIRELKEEKTSLEVRNEAMDIELSKAVHEHTEEKARLMARIRDVEDNLRAIRRLTLGLGEADNTSDEVENGDGAANNSVHDDAGAVAVEP